MSPEAIFLYVFLTGPDGTLVHRVERPTMERCIENKTALVASEIPALCSGDNYEIVGIDGQFVIIKEAQSQGARND